MVRITQDGLPVITADTINVFLRDLHQRGNNDISKEYIHEKIDILSKENPDFAKFLIDYFVNGNFPDDFKGGALRAAIFTYELLRRQAESYKLPV